jgi:DEAD/DEAH box helicase domain-containing protein
MDHVVVDVEIEKTIEQCSKGWDSTDEMGVGVAVVYEYNSDRYRVYGPQEVTALRDRLLTADRITGYNIWNFDFPVIWGLSRPEWAKPTVGVAGLKKALLLGTNDILRRIWQAKDLDPDNFRPATHGGYKLDDVAGWTLGGVSKIGHGADAPKWYQQGLIQKVANYCIDDVAIERELGEFVDRYGYVVAPGGRILVLPLLPHQQAEPDTPF